jgi:hypothetical protein
LLVARNVDSLRKPNARVNRRQAAKRVDVLLNNQLGNSVPKYMVISQRFVSFLPMVLTNDVLANIEAIYLFICVRVDNAWKVSKAGLKPQSSNGS